MSALKDLEDVLIQYEANKLNRMNLKLKLQDMLNTHGFEGFIQAYLESNSDSIWKRSVCAEVVTISAQKISSREEYAEQTSIIKEQLNSEISEMMNIYVLNYCLSNPNFDIENLDDADAKYLQNNLFKSSGVAQALIYNMYTSWKNANPDISNEISDQFLKVMWLNLIPEGIKEIAEDSLN